LPTRHHFLIAVAGVVLLALLGCQRDAIETHRAPHEEPPPPPEAKVRLLGAIIPHGPDTWFFKLVGKLDAVEARKSAFEDFARSVRFDKPGEASWTLPEGWERLPDDPDHPDRYATLRAGPKDAALELTVHKFGDAEKTRSDFENVARWGRNDVGVRVGWVDLGQYVRYDTTKAGVPMTLVDVKGPGGQGGGMKPPHAPSRPGKPTYTVPEGWKEIDPGGGQFAPLVALKVEEGGASARVTISQSGGGLLMNINRWRGQQLGLPDLDEAQLRDAKKVVKLADEGGIAVDFTGPGQPPGKGERRILGVVVPREGASWFIKMDGPADLVGRQKAAFEKFVGSVKLDGGKGG
jgi:hypothetical protein